MITLIYGDDTAASRNYLFELKSRTGSSVYFEGDKVSITDLVQELDSESLFQEQKTIILEQLLTKKKAGKEKETILSYLHDKAIENEIILWEGKDLEKKTLSGFRYANLKQFKIPQTLFLFLDNIKPNNTSKLISSFHQAAQKTELEMIFFMLIRQFRLLLSLKEQTQALIEETKRLAPWQKEKLQRQANLFDKKQLINLYTKLAKIDQANKTGTLNRPFASAIDFFLLEI